MTREESLLLSAYTGFMLTQNFGELQKFCEETLGRSVWTHDFADKQIFCDLRAKLQPKLKEMIQNIDKPQMITREQVEKMRGEWNVSYDELNGLTYVTCSKCEDETVLDGCFVTVEGEPCGLSDFCPACGSPMTDEAVDMMLERWKEAVDGEAKTD